MFLAPYLDEENDRKPINVQSKVDSVLSFSSNDHEQEKRYHKDDDDGYDDDQSFPLDLAKGKTQ